MGAFLDKPKTDKTSSSGEGNNLQWAVSCMQGWRVEMEDAHTSLPILSEFSPTPILDTKEDTDLTKDDLKAFQDWSFYAVFDGHAGNKTSQYSSVELPKYVLQSEEFQRLKELLIEEQENAEAGGNEDTFIADSIKNSIKLDLVRGSFVDAFLEIDDVMRNSAEVKSGEDRSGTTATCVLISPDSVYLANCGDSRTIVVSNECKVSLFTKDHKPINPEEKDRILNAGGQVMIQRVNGSLAVSRALGDFEYKRVDSKGPTEQLVSPEPEIYEIGRNKNDIEFVLLACDGVWDVMSNEDAAEFIYYMLMVTNDLPLICEKLIDTCLHKGSRDNISVCIIKFPNAPKINPAIKAQDNECDEWVITKTEEFVVEQADNHIEIGRLVRQIEQFSQQENAPSFPPGGGVQSKRALIEETFRALRPQQEEDTECWNAPSGPSNLVSLAMGRDPEDDEEEEGVSTTYMEHVIRMIGGLTNNNNVDGEMQDDEDEEYSEKTYPPTEDKMDTSEDGANSTEQQDSAKETTESITEKQEINEEPTTATAGDEEMQVVKKEEQNPESSPDKIDKSSEPSK